MTRRYPSRPGSSYPIDETSFEPVRVREGRNRPRHNRAPTPHGSHGKRRAHPAYRETRPIGPHRPRRAPPMREAVSSGKTPFTGGTYVGLLGKVMYLVAIFLPWYVVMSSVDAGPYSTDGWVELVRIDGLRGIQINELLTGGGVPRPASWLPVPLSWVLLFFFIWSVISIFRAKTAGKRGWKFVRGGAVILFVFGLIYFMVTRLAQVAPQDPAELRMIMEYVARAPLGGAATESFGEYGSMDLSWGLEKGGYLLFLSGMMQLLGGFMEWGSNKR